MQSTVFDGTMTARRGIMATLVNGMPRRRTGISTDRVKALVSWRMSARVEQKDVAARLDISTERLSNWELGKRGFPPEYVDRYVTAVFDLAREVSSRAREVMAEIAEHNRDRDTSA